MPASYPNSVKVFTTKTTGQTILASHINEPQDEITAIEQGLLQGLAHALFPNTDAGQDLGTTTKRWRNLLVQKIAAGITNATRLRVQEVGTSTWITVNADFDGANWNREDTTQPAQGIEINNNKEVKYYRAAAGTNPITWTNVFTISTDRITASQAVIGTDPGGTEVLRAQNLRAGATTITGNLTAPTAVIGTDPGGTEVLRAQNLRAGAITLTSTFTAPTVVVGTDPGGTEKLRAENLRAGSTTITAGLSVPSSLPTYGSDSSVPYVLSETTYADRVAWTSAALHNIFASATNIVVETSDDGTTWTTGNADDFRRIVRRASSSSAVFTSQYVRFTFDVGTGNIGRHIIATFGVQTNLTRVLRVERSGDGGNTWTTVLNDVTFSGAEQTRVFATSASVYSKVRITLWATTWSAGNTHVLSWLCGTTYHPFRSDAWRAPRLGQPDGSTRPALMSNTDVVPLADNTYDVGTSSLRWRSIYGVSGVFGTDPGGTESLRAGSARLNAPVLLGSVPQFTMAADPTAALQVATKQYADTKVSRTGDTMSGALVVGTDPGGTELLRAQSLRAGSGRVGTWRPIGVIQPATDVTSIQFAGLGITPPAVLQLSATVRNTVAGIVAYAIRVNGETNSTDWVRQNVYGNGNTVGASRELDTSIVGAANLGLDTTIPLVITVGPGGFVTVVSPHLRPIGVDQLFTVFSCLRKNTAITTLDSIEIVADTENGIGENSVFFLEHLAP
jgi:hypothetical protein